MSSSQHEHEWTGAGEVPADDDFAAAIESEHSASERVLRGDSTELQETCTQAGEMSLAEPISWRQ